MFCDRLKSKETLEPRNLFYESDEPINPNFPTDGHTEDEFPCVPVKDWCFFYNYQLQKGSKLINVKLGDIVEVEKIPPRTGKKKRKSIVCATPKKKLVYFLRVLYIVRDKDNNVFLSGNQFYSKTTVLRKEGGNLKTIGEYNRLFEDDWDKFKDFFVAVTDFDTWVPLKAVNKIWCGLLRSEFDAGRPTYVSKISVIPILFTYEDQEPGSLKAFDEDSEIYHRHCKSSLMWKDEKRRISSFHVPGAIEFKKRKSSTQGSAAKTARYEVPEAITSTDQNDSSAPSTSGYGTSTASKAKHITKKRLKPKPSTSKSDARNLTNAPRSDTAHPQRKKKRKPASSPSTHTWKVAPLASQSTANNLLPISSSGLREVQITADNVVDFFCLEEKSAELELRCLDFLTDHCELWARLHLRLFDLGRKEEIDKLYTHAALKEFT